MTATRVLSVAALFPNRHDGGVLLNRLLLGSCLLCLILATGRTSFAQQPAEQPDLSPESKLYGLSLFWKEASYNFAYFDHVPGLNWDKAYTEFIPQVLA